MSFLRVTVAVALGACATSAMPLVSQTGGTPDSSIADPSAYFPAIGATSSTNVGPPSPASEPWPWKVGQWAVYRIRSKDGVALEQLRIVAVESCGFWVERWVHENGHRTTWTFCVRGLTSPDAPDLSETIWGVIERRDRDVVLAEDFRADSTERPRFGWLMSLVRAAWLGRSDVSQEDVATPAAVFQGALKTVATEGNVETTRWSHPMVPLGGTVREVAPDRERILVATGSVGRPHNGPVMTDSAQIDLARRQRLDQNVSEVVPCPIGVRLSPKLCETSPRKFLSVAFGLGGVSRNGDVPPFGLWTWRLQFGQRLRTGFHLIEELNSVASGETSWSPSVTTNEDHVSFGAGIRWSPFAPKPTGQGFAQFLLPQRYIDFRAFYFSAVVGANLRDRLTRMTAAQVSEDAAWSPMASLAVGLFEYLGQDWSFGPEFREQIAIYDGRLQRGWQLLVAIHLNGW